MALEQWDGEAITVRYHTFFLNEGIPPEGAPFREYMLAKGSGRIPLEQFFDAPRRMGQAVGITFNFEAIEHAPNTVLSHRLIALTPEHLEEAMIDALYAAYFEHGQNIGDVDVLVKIAGEVGLDENDIRTQLLSDAHRDEVLTTARQAQQAGISGVPFFIFNNTFAFSGAQSPDVVLNALRQAALFKI